MSQDGRSDNPMLVRPTEAQMSETLQLFRAELNKNMELSHPSHSPGHDAMRVALRWLFDELAAGWRPIDTAPRTGIAVLLLQPWRSGHDTVLIGHYANGWVDRHFEELRPKPTHWMPLPEPIRGYPYTTSTPGETA